MNSNTSQATSRFGRGALHRDGQAVGVESLEEFCKRSTACALAFSGGCDSSYLLLALTRRGLEVSPYFVKTAFQAQSELQDALRVADEAGVTLRVIESDILSQKHICENTSLRCYHCKTFLFSEIYEQMKHDGIRLLVDGTNASDNPKRRPGFMALAELGVLSPLRRAGLTKEDIRRASRLEGFSTAEKPDFSCLATHIPVGEIIVQGALKDVEASLCNRV